VRRVANHARFPVRAHLCQNGLDPGDEEIKVEHRAPLDVLERLAQACPAQHVGRDHLQPRADREERGLRWRKWLPGAARSLKADVVSESATMQELRGFGLHNGVTGDLSGISGDRWYSPAPKARKDRGEVLCR